MSMQQNEVDDTTDSTNAAESGAIPAPDEGEHASGKGANVAVAESADPMDSNSNAQDDCEEAPNVGESSVSASQPTNSTPTATE